MLQWSHRILMGTWGKICQWTHQKGSDRSVTGTAWIRSTPRTPPPLSWLLILRSGFLELEPKSESPSWVPTPKQVWSGPWEFAFLRNFQTIWTPMVLERHFEIHGLKQTPTGPHWVPREHVELCSSVLSKPGRQKRSPHPPSRVSHTCKD